LQLTNKQPDRNATNTPTLLTQNLSWHAACNKCNLAYHVQLYKAMFWICWNLSCSGSQLIFRVHGLKVWLTVFVRVEFMGHIKKISI